MGSHFRIVQWATVDRLHEFADRSVPWVGLIAIQAMLVLLYLEVTGTGIDQLRYIVYPFIWINLGLWAVLRIKPIAASPKLRGVAIFVASAYVLVLLVLPGKIGFASTALSATGFRVSWAVPRWGPLLAYNGEFIRFYFIPFEVIGYLALGYLVYANVLRIARSSLASLLGLVTCAGCSIPILVSVIGILGGAGTTIATTAYQWSYDIGTILFILVVVILIRGATSQ